MWRYKPSRLWWELQRSISSYLYYNNCRGRFQRWIDPVHRLERRKDREGKW